MNEQIRKGPIPMRYQKRHDGSWPDDLKMVEVLTMPKKLIGLDERGVLKPSRLAGMSFIDFKRTIRKRRNR